MANRLSRETSPYLRQHADNPVDWYPWGEEALARARTEGKPILLSIGYSACHWCHVMAHESFEDEDTARLMNRLYVNVKVDREERPDLDHLYQATHRLLGDRGGGWPLTVLMTPELVPFFSGTYFPPVPRHGLPALRDLLERAEHVYRTKPQDVERLGADLRETLVRRQPRAADSAAEWDRRPIESAVATLATNVDPLEGGFGPAGRGPKFPQPQLLSFLLRHRPEPVLLTLRKMAEGGLYDQIGGGFCRYSVDAHWTIPHFEKMLYDNGALLALYADAWVLTGEPLFARAVEETIAWASREMLAPQGAFYGALDADSEGEEGRFYVWSPAEVQAALEADEWAVLGPHYGLNGPPNFEGTAWHLRVTSPLSSVAAALGMPLEAAARRLQSARAKLLRVRSVRVRPGLDDKILVSWNALMVRGLARAARVFGRADWLARAQATVDFLRNELWREGRLSATFQGGRARLAGYLDDAAFLLDALLELMQAQFRIVDLDFAGRLARMLLERYEDRESGGFFFTAHDHEVLLHRDKPAEDGATPSGNGVAAAALLRLAHVTGEAEYGRAAERVLALFEAPLREAPFAMPGLLGVLEEYLEPPALVVLRGPAAQLADWQARLATQFLPHTITLALPEDLSGLPPVLTYPSAAEVHAYVCIGTSCSEPIADPDRLIAQLGDSRA